MKTLQQVYKNMLAAKLVWKMAPSSEGSGSADQIGLVRLANDIGFCFKISDRNRIAEHLKEVDRDQVFLNYATYPSESDKKLVYFWSNSGEIPLRYFRTPDSFGKRLQPKNNWQPYLGKVVDLTNVRGHWRAPSGRPVAINSGGWDVDPKILTPHMSHYHFPHPISHEAIDVTLLYADTFIAS